jgi:hypothetical protein
VRAQVFAILTALTLASGCSKQKPSDICARRAIAACSFLYGCCEPLERYQLADLDGLDPTGGIDLDEGSSFVIQVNDEPTESGCENVFEAQCNTMLAYLNAAADEGRITLDDAAIDACLKPLEDAVDSCEPNAFFNYDGDVPEQCTKMITGTVVGGGDCYSRVECAAEGSICEPPPEMGPQPEAPIRKLTGVCSAPPQLGQACENGQCAPSLYCDNAMMKCVAKVASGGDCSNAQCQDDLFCDQNSRCVSPPGSGQPCGQPPNQCARELVCRDDVCRPANLPPVHQYCDGT